VLDAAFGVKRKKGDFFAWRGVFSLDLPLMGDPYTPTLHYSPQNFFPRGINAPQDGQLVSILAQQSSQNFTFSLFSDWQFGHFILFSYLKIF